jgi:hypothetical protein
MSTKLNSEQVLMVGFVEISELIFHSSLFFLESDGEIVLRKRGQLLDIEIKGEIQLSFFQCCTIL